MKVKPGFYWQPQDVGDAVVVEYLPWRSANEEWNQLRREKCVAVKKAERSWRAEGQFDIRHGDAESGVCPAGFQFYFGPAFPSYILCHTFWNGNVYYVPLYVIRFFILIL